MKILMKNYVLLAVMLLMATIAWAMRPTILIADRYPQVNLEEMVPRQFFQWKELRQSTGQIINPQQIEKLKKLYSQILSRTYIREDGITVMLSIAYGVNQSDGVALHYPEVCYPSQGFQLLSNESATLNIGISSIPVKRLTTKLGDRAEPVTYWVTLGDYVVQEGIHTKIAQLKYGFKGQIPDGLLFRVSSINFDANSAFNTQTEFIRDLMQSLSNESRIRLIGRF
jgi:EpsI family protein